MTSGALGGPNTATDFSTNAMIQYISGMECRCTTGSQGAPARLPRGSPVKHCLANAAQRAVTVDAATTSTLGDALLRAWAGEVGQK